jgi:8-oxo-dGTP diphosphatase
MSFEKLSPSIIRQHKGISFPGVTTVFMCHDGAGHVFLSQRSANTRDEQGRWDIGGGGLKQGQSIEDNARREIKEEYGAIPLEMEFLGYRDAFRELSDGTPTHWVAMDFLVLVDPAEVKLMEPDMADDGGWFTLDTLPSPLHSQIEMVFLPKYRDILRVKLGTQ